MAWNVQNFDRNLGRITPTSRAEEWEGGRLLTFYTKMLQKKGIFSDSWQNSG